MTITLEQVRMKIGSDTTDLISDADINRLITDNTNKVYNYFDFKAIPTDTIEFYRGYDINDIKVNKSKIMTLQNVNINGTDRGLTTFTFDENLSKIQTRREYHREWVSLFPKDSPYRIKVKYSYAMLKPEGTATETTADISSGTSVAITVDTETGFNVDDYVRIQGNDGNNEVVKVTATDTNEITVDKLILDHGTESLVQLLIVPKIIENYILYDVCYTAANNIVGSTSALPTSVSNEGMSATVGVAYTHWRDARDAFGKERDKLESSVWALKTTIL